MTIHLNFFSIKFIQYTFFCAPWEPFRSTIVILQDALFGLKFDIPHSFIGAKPPKNEASDNRKGALMEAARFTAFKRYSDNFKPPIFLHHDRPKPKRNASRSLRPQIRAKKAAKLNLDVLLFARN